VGIEIVPPFSTTVQPSVSPTEVLQGGTISMPNIKEHKFGRKLEVGFTEQDC
jgi:hypothetical protein